MKLTELNPRWVDGHPDRKGIAVEFDCPGPCCAGKPSIAPAFHDPGEGTTKKQRLYVRLARPLDGGAVFNLHPGCTAWDHSGTTFDDLTLMPSVDASGFGHWHGFITNGEVR